MKAANVISILLKLNQMAFIQYIFMFDTKRKQLQMQPHLDVDAAEPHYTHCSQKLCTFYEVQQTEIISNSTLFFFFVV